MSSPIAHGAAGYAIYSTFRRALPRQNVLGFPARLAWPVIAIIVCLLPDLDAIAAWLLGSMERCHNNLTHSLTAALAGSVLLAGLMRRVAGTSWTLGFRFIFTLALSHLVIDVVTLGRGLMLFWPFTLQRYMSPVIVFTGVPWSAHWNSPLYLRMLAEDTCFALAVLGVVWLVRRRSGHI